MSYTFKLNDDFTSIPGLVQYFDGRFGAQLDNNGRIVTMQDLSGNGTNVYQTNSFRKPYYTDNFIDSDAIVDTNPKYLLKPPESSLRFLNDGSPFGVYTIFGFNATGTTSNFQLLDTGANPTRNGFLFRINATLTGTITVRITQAGSNLLNTTSSAIAGRNAIQSAGVVRTSLNESNNLKIYSNDVQINQLTTSAASNTDPLSYNLNTVGGGFGVRSLMGLFLIYNWKGKTSAEVLSLDAKVRSLMEAQKSSFVYPT